MSDIDALPEADRNFILANLELAGVDITDPREASFLPPAPNADALVAKYGDPLGRFERTKDDQLKRLRLVELGVDKAVG